MLSVGQKANNIPPLIISGANAFYTYVAPRSTFNPNLDELLEFGIVNFLQANCGIGHEARCSLTTVAYAISGRIADDWLYPAVIF